MTNNMVEKCPSIRPSVRTYVRTYVRTSTIKLTPAIRVIHRWIGGDETNRTVCHSRSSKVKVKVSDLSKFGKCPFSTLNNYISDDGASDVIRDYCIMGQFLNSHGPDF